MATHVYRINFIRKSPSVKLASPYLAKKHRKLPGSSNCLINNFPETVTLSEFQTYAEFPYPYDSYNCCPGSTLPPTPPSYQYYDPTTCIMYDS